MATSEERRMERIPDRLIFIWLGRRLPAWARAAVRSAHNVCRSGDTLLLHENLDPDSLTLGREPGIRLERVTPSWFRGLPHGRLLGRLFDDLPSPTARSNVLRLAALYRLGGIYLDTDTITIRDLADLRRHRGFCGLEHVACPGEVRRTGSPLPWARTGALHAARYLCTLHPAGVRAFRRLERFYHLVASNAVMGSEPGNLLVERALEEIGRLRPRERRRPYALGVHLVQRLTRSRSSEHMEVLAPETFYPLGPDISVHWFRPGSARRMDDLLSPGTRVVHWYSAALARLRGLEPTREYIEGNRNDVAFAALAAPHL